MAKKAKKIEEENYKVAQPAQNALIREAGIKIDAILQEYGLVMIPIIQVQSKEQYLKDTGALMEIPKNPIITDPLAPVVLDPNGDIPPELIQMLRPDGDKIGG